MGTEEAQTQRETRSTPAETTGDVASSSKEQLLGHCELFQQVCAAIDPTEDLSKHGLLQELRLLLERGQAELQTKITLVEDEARLMDLLAVNDVVDAAMAIYRQQLDRATKTKPASESSTTAPAPASSTIENELMDLLGMAAPP